MEWRVAKFILDCFFFQVQTVILSIIRFSAYIYFKKYYLKTILS